MILQSMVQIDHILQLLILSSLLYLLGDAAWLQLDVTDIVYLHCETIKFRVYLIFCNPFISLRYLHIRINTGCSNRVFYSKKKECCHKDNNNTKNNVILPHIVNICHFVEEIGLFI